MSSAASGGRFSSLLLEGLDEYRRGNMKAAVRAWEEAYTLEPTNPRAREFLHSALERIYAQMGVQKEVPAAAPGRDAGFASAPLGAARLGTEQVRRAPAEPRHAPSPAPQPQPQQPAAPTTETAVWLGGARDLMGGKDYAGALELLSKVLAAEPQHAQALELRGESEAALTRILEAKLGGLQQRPRVLLKPDEIRWLDLDPRAGFVLAQIDGTVSYEDLYDICGLARLDTVRILAQLVDEKVIGHAKE